MWDCEEEEDMILMIDWRRLCEEGERMMIDLGRHTIQIKKRVVVGVRSKGNEKKKSLSLKFFFFDRTLSLIIY